MKRLLVLLVLPGLTAIAAGAAPRRPARKPGPMLAKALAGPMKGVTDIIFANRSSYSDGHWYANIGYYCDDEKKPAYAANGKPGTGRLCKLNLPTGKLTVILDTKGGSIRDPQVHYDAKKILFSMRKPKSHFYNLYEINIDGSGLKQITSGRFDDYEPTYLPDGGIVFVSTRCKRWVNCWMTQVGTLFRCDAKGGDIVQISSNNEHDNTPAVLPDGRIVFTRWEYTDRSQIGYHHLWTVNPDGTRQMVYYGNQRHYPLYIDAKPIPGTNKIIGLESPGHGQRDHYGAVAIFSDAFGPDDARGIRKLTSNNRKGRYIDPWAFNENCVLAAQYKTIQIINGKGQSEVIYSSNLNCHEPRPIIKRARERVVLPVTNPSLDTGQLVLTDVYNGRNMGGIKRGDIKKLLILESLPKPVNFSGGPDLTSWLGTFTLERVLGTVPVEEDGSASFTLPANRAVFFVALDENDLSVKRMQSFVSVAPGEVTSCAGCHENRTRTAPVMRTRVLQAMKRPPSKIKRFEGYPDVLDFNRDIQPIFDKHCVKCHNPTKFKGKLSLAGDLGRMWSLPYYAMFARLQVADGRNGYGNQPPRTIGTYASPLMKKINGTHAKHKKVKVSQREWRTIWMWIESAAPYAGSYGGLRNKEQQGREGHAAGTALGGVGAVLKRRCGSCHNGKKLPRVPFHVDGANNRGIKRPVARHERKIIPNDPLALYSSHAIVNITRPEFSSVLMAPLAKKAGGRESCPGVFKTKNDPDYKRMLASLQLGKTRMDATPRFGTPQFKPNRQYIREMKKYGVLPDSFDPSKDKIDVFETDQKYWKSLWYKPKRAK
ncbi:MAG: hypothetical protein QGG42_01460 [Phycisphaerae bacterium]|nr:hypothetical protein [Phycisphaerae bacterium]